MPIYEYRCDQGHVFEVSQRMTDDPVAKCEVCGHPVQRVFHPVAVHFKGKGFYSTDYGTRKRQRETAAAAEGSASADSSGGGSAESRSGERKPDKSSSGEGAGKSSGGSEGSERPAKKAQDS